MPVLLLLWKQANGVTSLRGFLLSLSVFRSQSCSMTGPGRCNWMAAATRKSSDCTSWTGPLALPLGTQTTMIHDRLAMRSRGPWRLWAEAVQGRDEWIGALRVSVRSLGCRGPPHARPNVRTQGRLLVQRQEAQEDESGRFRAVLCVSWRFSSVRNIFFSMI